MSHTERKFLAPIFLILLLIACGGKNTGSYVKSPGTEESAKTRVLETGTAMLQSKAPIDAINIYLDGFHFYNGNIKGQMEAHHYCSVMNEDLIQCVIFDGNRKNSKLMGVEYIISRNAYQTLLADEKKLWHSHSYEVKSGELIAPGVPKPAEYAFMEKAASTYGKTWHTWNTDQGRTLPTGHPLLMMGFTADGQINGEMLTDRDKRFGISTEKEKENRRDIQPPPVLSGVNSWETGEILQLSLGPLSQEAKAAMGGEHRMQSQPVPGK